MTFKMKEAVSKKCDNKPRSCVKSAIKLVSLLLFSTDVAFINNKPKPDVIFVQS